MRKTLPVILGTACVFALFAVCAFLFIPRLFPRFVVSNTPSSAQAVRIYLAHESDERIANALFERINAGWPAWESWALDAAHSKVIAERRLASAYLALYPSWNCVEALKQLSSDSDEYVRSNSLYSLSIVDPHEAKLMAEQMLGDRSSIVLRKVLEVLGNYGDEQSLIRIKSLEASESIEPYAVAAIHLISQRLVPSK